VPSLPPPTTTASDAPPAPASGRPQPPQGPRGIWRAVGGLVLGLLAGLFLTLVVEIAGHAFGSPINHPTPAVSLAGDYVFDVGFVASAIYFAFLGGSRDPALLGFRRVYVRRALVLVAAAAVVYYAVTFLYGSLVHIHGSDKLPNELGVNHHTAALVGATVFVCVFAPICEELFFRGFLFGTLASSLRLRAGRVNLAPWVSAVIVGVLFGLAHTGSANSVYLVPLGFLGFVLCLVRWRTGSIYPTIALHSINNCVALGANQLGWNAGEIVALMAGSLAVIGLITGPLGRRGAPIAAGR
jgi:membrane protease YdiL (CAAX protease family)